MEKVSIHLFDVDRGEIYKCLRKCAYAQKIEFDDGFNQLSIIDLIKADYLIKEFESHNRSYADFFLIYKKNFVSIFGDNFKPDNILKIVDKGFYTRKIKYVLISIFDNDYFSLVIYHAGKKLAEYVLSTISDDDCMMVKTAKNIDLLNKVTGLNLNGNKSPYTGCQKVTDILEKLVSDSNLPLNLSFQDVSECPEEYNAIYENFYLLDVPKFDFLPMVSIHVLKSDNRTIGNKLADIYNLKLLPFSECKQQVMFISLAGRSVYNNGNFSFFSPDKKVIEDNKKIKALSEYFRENFILRYMHTYDNKYSFSLFKSGEIISELLLEINSEGQCIFTPINIATFENLLDFDFNGFINLFDPRDAQYYMENYLSKTLNLPLMFSYNDISDFYEFCEPDQYVYDNDYYFDDKEYRFNEDEYSSETLRIIKNLFF